MVLRWEVHVKTGQSFSTPVEKAFGKPIHDPKALDGYIRRAYHALLDEKMTAEDGNGEVPKDSRAPCTHATWKNSVCVSVSGVGLVDIEVVKLPGTKFHITAAVYAL